MTEITVSRAPDLADLERRWRDLEQRASPSFFQSWTWTGCLAAERFPKPLLVEARENGRTVALALFNRRRGTLYLGENGDPRLDAIYIEHNGVLAETGRENELSGPCLRAARQATLGPRRRLMLAGIDERTIASAHETGDAQCYRTQQAPYLFLKNIDGDFLDGRSANTRQQMRRSDRHYAALGPLTLERADTVPRAHEFLFGLKGLHQATWTARGRPGAFAQGFFEQFHRALIGRGLPRGEINLLRVSAGEHVVGFLYNFHYRGRVSTYQSGFDYGGAGRHGKPGLTCHHQAIRLAHERGAERYEFLAGDDRYKRSLSDRTETLHWIEMDRCWSLRSLARGSRDFARGRLRVLRGSRGAGEAVAAD